jgi:hypothetical protein
MAEDRSKALASRKSSEIDAFLRQVAAAPKTASTTAGRLIFALDATASRQPTWDRACHIQAEMFATAASLGGLSIQLCFFRGFGEFQAVPWLMDGTALVKRMTGVTCQAGRTQIARVLRHAIEETGRARVNAIVYVGDCMEESADGLLELGGKLGLLGVPAFLFQEGDDAVARQVFEQLAKLTGGAYAQFNAASAKTLRDLLMAVAVYAAGGRRALAHYADHAGAEILRLTRQLR